MSSIYEDDFVELEGGILTNPVGVEDAESSATATNTLLLKCSFSKDLSIQCRDTIYLSDGLEVALGLQGVDTMGLGLAIGAALGYWALATTAANANTVDDEP